MMRDPRDPAIFPETSISRRAILKGVGAGVAGGAFAVPAAAQGQAASPTSVTSHPRLWLTAEDLPRLRGWATDANPLWRDGLLPLAEQFRTAMDDGTIRDTDDGGLAYTDYPAENAAQCFAFVSLLHPDAATGADYAERARTLLMGAIGEAAKGPAAGEPFRDPAFSIYDRSRWWGAGFPLTVDWIYPLLTDDDKATIREVFLRWVGENAAAETTTMNHPEPAGVVNDPALLADPVAVRWAGNNYFTAHMRNIGLMALALDAADDPGGELTGNLAQATGAWLYMVDELLNGESRGGLTAEGFEYTPLALSYVVQFLLALHTAGQDDPARWGRQVVLAGNPFWNELLPALLHSLSPAPTTLPDAEWMGPVYQPAWFGDGETYWSPDFIGVLGALGRHDDLTGNTMRLEAIRWVQTHLQPGGADGLLYRVSSGFSDAHIAMFYFLLFDPAAGEGEDPRPGYPLIHYASGIGRLLARTSWGEDATWFTWALGWNTVDHQHADGNQVEFYRAGEWLTKERTGYGFNIGASDYHNTLALENDPPDHNEPGDYRYDLWTRGSQWMIVAGGDPEVVALSAGEGFIYALGDATNLYNSTYELSTDILHASRAVVWLQPDQVVIHDRAASKTAGRFKRFWLNLPAEATVEGSVTTMTTANGQHLVVTTLLPDGAEIAVEPAEALEEAGEVAAAEPMRFRLRVEAPGGPPEATFLHVLQGVDGGGTADAVTRIERSAGTPFAGVVVAGTAVLFLVEIGAGVAELTWATPAGTARHLVTGLAPGSRYDVETSASGGELAVTIRTGTAVAADEGGVLDLRLP